MNNVNFPTNFTKEEICSIIENALPYLADPKEIINGILMAAGRYIGFVTVDNDITNRSLELMFKCYIEKGREEAKQNR